MPRKGENIYKRKDGRWEARYIKERSPNGKAIYGYVYAKSYYEVKNKVASIVDVPNGNNEQILFSEIANNWLDVVKQHHKESTYNKYRNLLHTYIYPTYKDTLFHVLTHNSLQKFCNHLLESSGQKHTMLSPNTVLTILTIIRNIFCYAEKCGYHSPCNLNGITVKQPIKELTILSRLEQEKLCQYLCNNLSYRNFGILLCLYTGLRLGEICALQWNDISLEEKTLSVHNTLQRIQTPDDLYHKTKIIHSVPKSKCSIRTIPLPSNIIEIIESHFKGLYGYVLTGSEDKFVEPRTMQNHFKKVLKESNIRQVNYHVLRHTFATCCIEVGFDVKSLSEILGHANVNITMNRYIHPTMELKQKNMEKLSELFAVKILVSSNKFP